MTEILSSPPRAARKAAVTGSSSGIGLAIAQELISGGWEVIGLDIMPATIDHNNFTAVKVDLCNSDELREAAQVSMGAQALIHAAGFMRIGALGKMNLEDGGALWRIHVDAAFRLSNVLVPAMGRGGRIVLIGSRVSTGAPLRSQYAACKAALVAMARSWAAELLSSGITVNVVSPAATETAMLDDSSRRADPPKLPAIGRFIRPSEIAALVGFLLSPRADAITGQEIRICGGASLAR